jgi:hypothetical protein
MRLAASLTAVTVLAGSATVLGADVRFDELVRHPERFNGKTVSVVGVAEDGGDRLGIYRDVDVRRRVDLRHFFSAYIPREFPNYPGTNMGHYAYANARWIRVKGTVDTRIRGRWGTDRFGLRLQSLTLLPRPRLMEFICDSAVILNMTFSEVRIEVKREDGGTYFGIGADDTAYDACISENGTVTAILPNGRRVTSRPLIASQLRRYYNPRQKEYYYRVTERSVILSPPSEAREWKRYPSPDRDP